MFAFALFFYACTNSTTTQQTQTDSSQTAHETVRPAPVVYDTISTLDSLKEADSAVFKLPDGRCYIVTSTKGALETEATAASPDTTQDHMRVTAAASSPGSTPCQGESFDGSDRKKAKTSFSSAAKQDFPGLDSMLITLPSDSVMGHHTPAISTSSTSTRVAEERRNVHISQTWIFAFAREGDEDYHVIIGTTSDKNTATFFNAEISGLPASLSGTTFNKINNARNDFTAHFGITTCHSGYQTQFMDNPVPVEITGSLLFDELHYSQHASIGTGVAKPTTYWEIHPISAIIFL